MIEKMQMVHIVTTTSGKQEMLEGLRDIGILHLSEKKSADKAAADRVLVHASCWPENASSLDGNLVNADPLFRSPARGDYRLRRGSPCVDAGLWEALGATREEVRGQADAAGARRLTGLSVDMGCCENGQHGLMLLVR